MRSKYAGGGLVLILSVILQNPHPAVRSAIGHTGARFYRGNISVSTEWEGIIRVTGQVTISKGVTLTIAPGTKVLLGSGEDMNIVVEGKLFVRGLPAMEVVFAPADGCDENTFWGGIIFLEGSRGEIEGAIIRCSKKGILANGMDVRIGDISFEGL